MRIKNIIFSFMSALLCTTAPLALADDGGSFSVGDIASNLFDVSLEVHSILKAVLIIAGAALILGSFLQYKKYRENPIETRLSTVIFIFFLGLLLIAIAFIPMASIGISPE